MIDVKVLEYIAKEAGKIILSHYKSDNIIEFKRDDYGAGSIVTAADKKTEEFVRSQLTKYFPNHNIFGEEFGLEDKNSEYTWYIDPIDGTSNFSREIPLFGFSLGLIHSGIPIAGVIFIPLINELYVAKKGEGAYCNGKKISVSSRSLKQSAYFGNHGPGKKYFFPTLEKEVGVTQFLICSSFELVSLAKGTAEIYHGMPSLHDIAAGICIIREAGGKATDYDGNEWTADSSSLLITNGSIHQEVLDLIQKDL